MTDKVQNIGFLFDLDGVLIDSESEYSKIWAQINKEFPTGIDNFEYKIKGCTLSKILKENYPDIPTREAVCSRLHELEDQMHYDYKPFAKEFLDLLNENKLKCALVTSSDNQKMAHLQEEIPELLDYFSFVVTGEKVRSSKPSPEGYILAAKELGVNPQKSVVFEDSLQGVKAGQNAGAYVVGIKGTLPEESLAPFSHIVIETFNEIDLQHLIQILLYR